MTYSSRSRRCSSDDPAGSSASPSCTPASWWIADRIRCFRRRAGASACSSRSHRAESCNTINVLITNIDHAYRCIARAVNQRRCPTNSTAGACRSSHNSHSVLHSIVHRKSTTATLYSIDFHRLACSINSFFFFRRIEKNQWIKALITMIKQPEKLSGRNALIALSRMKQLAMNNETIPLKPMIRPCVLYWQ